MSRAPATAKINLALVVGAARADGKHEVATVLQRIDLADASRSRPRSSLEVAGFPDDTLVRARARRAGRGRPSSRTGASASGSGSRSRAGLGGGSSDAATALRLANEPLPEPLATERLPALAAGLGADVPFFLTEGPQLGRATAPTSSRSTCRRTTGSSSCCRPRRRSPRRRRSTRRSTSATGGFDERQAAARRVAAIRLRATSPGCPPTTSPPRLSPRSSRARRLPRRRHGRRPGRVRALRRSAEAEAAAPRALGPWTAWLTAPAWYG